MKIGYKQLFPLVMLVMLTITGCQHDPYADWFVTKDVAGNVLAGSYHVTPETIERFSNKEMPFIPGGRLPISREARIVLNSNHKVSLANIPIDWVKPALCILNGNGDWKVDKREDYTIVFVTLTAAYASPAGCPNGQFGFALELFDDSALHPRSRTKYPLLHLTIGDPDSGDALQFEKD